MAVEDVDTWVESELSNRNLQDIPENRRALRTEYLKTNRPASTGTTTNTGNTNVATPSTAMVTDVSAQGAQKTQDQWEQDIANVASKADESKGPLSGTTYIFPSRVVLATSQNVSAAAKDTVDSAKFVETPGGVRIVYSGNQLVNKDGVIERGQYQANGADVYSEYASITDPTELTSLLTTLKDYQFYGESKPSALALSGRGLTGTDEAAIQRFLNYSSSQGRTWRAMLPLVQGTAKLVTGGSGRTISVVSTEDATEEFKQQSLAALGRMPTKAEITRAVQAIQSQERARGAGGTMDAPSLRTAAAEQARAAAPGEATAQTVGSAMNRLFALLGGA